MHTRFTREVPGMLDMSGAYQMLIAGCALPQPRFKIITSESCNQMTGHKHEGLKVQAFFRGRLCCRSEASQRRVGARCTRGV